MTLDQLCGLELDTNEQVKCEQLKLMAARLTQLSDLNEARQAANDLVTLISVEMRTMVKTMRIFGATMLTNIAKLIPTQTVIQMMQKESMFEQKFV